jgi:hypothetical protein
MEANSNSSVFNVDFLTHLQHYLAGIYVGASFHYVALPPSVKLIVRQLFKFLKINSLRNSNTSK